MAGNQESVLLGVGEVAARSGVSVSTLHFYEKKGLIRSARNSGNHRRYPRAILRRVAVIRVAQRVGVPLAEIRRALKSLPDERTRPPPTGLASHPSGRSNSTSASTPSPGYAINSLAASAAVACH